MADSINKLRVGITKRYGSKTVLDHLSLEIRGGEFVTFLGPSGCGKSTALGIIAGLVPPTEGEIWLDEQRIDDLLPEKRGFGMVFQNYALFPHLTVFGNVAFGLSLQRKPAAEIKERVGTMLDLVRLSVDPYANTDSQHETAVEPDSFSFGSTVVAAFQVGRREGGAASNIGTAVSSDAGRTWQRSFLPGTTVYATPPGPELAASDPSVRIACASGAR